MNWLQHTEPLRRPLRRGCRLRINRSRSKTVRQLVARLPFSRYARLTSQLFWGKEMIEHNGVTMIYLLGMRE